MTIEASKRVRFDIEKDVIRGRGFDLGRKFLPDGLALPARFAAILGSLTTGKQRDRIGGALGPVLADVGPVEQRLAA
jgi:hypothetical protein